MLQCKHDRGQDSQFLHQRVASGLTSWYCRPEALYHQAAQYGDLELHTEQTVQYANGSTYRVRLISAY